MLGISQTYRRMISKFFPDPEPVTLTPALRAFLISLRNGTHAPSVEEENPQMLAQALRWKVAEYDYGSYQNDGWYVVTRLGRVSLAAEDKLARFRPN